MILGCGLGTKSKIEKKMVVVKVNLYNNTEEILDKIPSRKEMNKIIEKEDVKQYGWVTFWAYEPIFDKYGKRVIIYNIACEEDGVGLISKADESLVKSSSCQTTEVLGVGAVSCYHTLKEDVYVLCGGETILIEKLPLCIQKAILEKVENK